MADTEKPQGEIEGEVRGKAKGQSVQPPTVPIKGVNVPDPTAPPPEDPDTARPPD